MEMYGNNDDSDSEEDIRENPSDEIENPSKILCFFVVQGSEEIHALVQSCHVINCERDSILFQCWSKEYIRRGNIFQPMLI